MSVEPGSSPRERLRRRQHEVVDDLLRGRVPPDFDERTSLMAGRVLAGKRVEAMETVAPELTWLPSWRDHAVRFVRESPQEGCAHDDRDRFVRWVRREHPAGSAGWLRLVDVLQGRRRICLARLADGRRVALIRIGRRTHRLSWGETS